MSMNRAAFLPLLEEGLRKVYFYWLDQKTLTYPDLYDVRSSRKRKETDQTVAGIGMIDRKEEGEPTTYDDFVMGYQKEYIHDTFSKGIRLTQELLEDELYGIMGQRAKALGNATRYRMEYDAAALFNNADSATAGGGVAKGADGLALLHTAHTLAAVPGTTISNKVSSALTLSALENAFTHFRTLRDDRNLLVMAKPAVLLIPPQLEFDAAEMLKSSGKPYTADNEINALQDRLQIKVWDFLTDSDCWFVLAEKRVGAPTWFDRVRPQFMRDGDFDTDIVKMKARVRYSRGYTDWRWCYGSMGA